MCWQIIFMKGSERETFIRKAFSFRRAQRELERMNEERAWYKYSLYELRVPLRLGTNVVLSVLEE